MNEIKKVLVAKGYLFPKSSFKTQAARSKFVAEHGYDPDLLLVDTVSLADKVGPGWEKFVAEYSKPMSAKRKR